MKGSAMPLAIMFSAFTALFLAASMGHWQENTMLYSRNDAIRQADAAIYASCLICCRDMSILEERTEHVHIQPFPGKNIEVAVSRRMHGLYEMLTFRTRLPGGGERCSVRLIGNSADKTGSSVVVKDMGREISIGDECLIESPLYVPQGRYRPLSQAGDGRHRLSGNLDVRKSPAVLPGTDARAAGAIRMIYSDTYPDNIFLSNADSIPDMVISARNVTVGSTFRNSVQIFAQDSIVLEDGAFLEYPSGIHVMSPDGIIIIKGNSVVEGYAIVSATDGKCDYKAGKINYIQSDSSIVRGLVMVDGKAEVRGTVTGSLYITYPVSRKGHGYSPMTIRGLTQIDGYHLPYPVFISGSSGMDIVKVLPPEFRISHNKETLP